MEIWDKPEGLDNLELQREEHRKKTTRLTFDCFQAKLKDDRVYCAKGHLLSMLTLDSTMGLVSVLRGRTSSQCKTCPDFDGE